MHFDVFKSSGLCVEFADKALDPNSVWAINAKALDFGEEANDGVNANARHFARLLEEGVAPVAPRAVWEAGREAREGCATPHPTCKFAPESEQGTAASGGADEPDQPGARAKLRAAGLALAAAARIAEPPPAGLDPGASLGGEGWSNRASNARSNECHKSNLDVLRKSGYVPTAARISLAEEPASVAESDEEGAEASSEQAVAVMSAGAVWRP